MDDDCSAGAGRQARIPLGDELPPFVDIRCTPYTKTHTTTRPRQHRKACQAGGLSLNDPVYIDASPAFSLVALNDCMTASFVLAYHRPQTIVFCCHSTSALRGTSSLRAFSITPLLPH